MLTLNSTMSVCDAPNWLEIENIKQRRVRLNILCSTEKKTEALKKSYRETVRYLADKTS